MQSLSFSIAHALPETVLAIGALALILLGAIRGEKSAGLVAEISIGVLALALVVIFVGAKSSADVFEGAFVDDQFARFMKVLVLIGSLVSLVLSRDFLQREGIDLFEFPVLILLSTLGMLLLTSANSLISLYLGLELMSLALYVVAGLLWLPVVWMQIQMRDLAAAAAQRGEPLPPSFHRLYRLWFAMGFPAFAAVLAILWLMITRPVALF